LCRYSGYGQGKQEGGCKRAMQRPKCKEHSGNLLVQ
jgi:hypothetical protein